MKEARQTVLALAAVCLVVAAGVIRIGPAGSLTRAEKLYADQKYSEVLSELKPALHRAPNAGTANYLAGKAAYRLGHFADAEVFFTRALAASPGSARCSMNLALSLHRQGKSAEAAAHYRDVMDNHADTDPDLAEKAEMAARAALVKTSIAH